MVFPRNLNGGLALFIFPMNLHLRNFSLYHKKYTQSLGFYSLTHYLEIMFLLKLTNSLIFSFCLHTNICRWVVWIIDYSVHHYVDYYVLLLCINSLYPDKYFFHCIKSQNFFARFFLHLIFVTCDVICHCDENINFNRFSSVFKWYLLFSVFWHNSLRLIPFSKQQASYKTCSEIRGWDEILYVTFMLLISWLRLSKLTAQWACPINKTYTPTLSWICYYFDYL